MTKADRDVRPLSPNSEGHPNFLELDHGHGPGVGCRGSELQGKGVGKHNVLYSLS